MAERQQAAYGEWPSALTADWVVQASRTITEAQWGAGQLWWLESRPEEQGRSVLVALAPGHEPRDVVPPAYDVRTRVHEYGGGAFTVHGATAFFSHFYDQRLYRLDPDEPPKPITPDPPVLAGYRYADGRVTPNGQWLLAVRERHESGGVFNELVALPTDGSAEPKVIVSGNDFYAAPRISPDGDWLCWLTWNHPNMPWDGTELWVGRLDEVGNVRTPWLLAGGRQESITQPLWAPDGTLYFLSDRTGWWNLYRWHPRNGVIEQVTQLEAEIGEPHWTFGQSRYVVFRDGYIAAIVTDRGEDRLIRVDPEGAVQWVEVPWRALLRLTADPSDSSRLWLIASSPAFPQALVEFSLQDGTWQVIRQASDAQPESTWISEPDVVAFPTEGEQTAYGFFYRPKNPTVELPHDETRPPLIVFCHGGPTGHVRPAFSPVIQYWTSRGFAVIDVNYGGSSGYGRAYRERLRERWGIVDVADCVNAVRYLTEQGVVDSSRVAIRGGSAGGYTTLRALTVSDVFAAGTSYYGVADLEALAKTTHKFESRYLDGLIGPYPDQAERYRERSPLYAIDHLRAPVLLLQGADDRVVPPEQAEIMVQSLERHHLPYAYYVFEGEGHGFRRAETIRRCLVLEHSFYATVFGLHPPESLEAVQLHWFGESTAVPEAAVDQVVASASEEGTEETTPQSIPMGESAPSTLPGEPPHESERMTE